MDKEPKPTPKETTDLTRKDSDIEFAAAMAPDADVPPLSSLPAPELVESHPARMILGKWLDEIGLNWIDAAEKLRDITGPGGDVHKPGMWFRLEPETAQKLLELCDWHLQEHGEMPGNPMQAKLDDVVRSFHAAKLEQRAEAEAAKAARAATLPVFEEPVRENVIHTFQVSYCYPQLGQWQGGGICEIQDGEPAYFNSLDQAREFARVDSLRNRRFLIHVTIHAEYPARTYDKCQQRGDLWYFQGATVPGGVSDGIPDAASLAQVGCVLELLSVVEEEAPAPHADNDLFGLDEPQGSIESARAFGDRLV